MADRVRIPGGEEGEGVEIQLEGRSHSLPGWDHFKTA